MGDLEVLAVFFLHLSSGYTGVGCVITHSALYLCSVHSVILQIKLTREKSGRNKWEGKQCSSASEV